MEPVSNKIRFVDLLRRTSTKAALIGESNSNTVTLGGILPIITLSSNLGGTFFPMAFSVKYDGTVALMRRNKIQIIDTQTQEPLFQSFIPLCNVGNADTLAVQDGGFITLAKPRLLRTGQSLRVDLQAFAVDVTAAGQVAVAIRGVYVPEQWDTTQIEF